ncbi:hypothetical protein FF36_00167 [Frankia torreyi]|uniref:Uncharacterized protein n=1 Tax=Frankia torreyi TaxID=1856 RepID=A0A0D8BN52_9ACTN|nr:MULTISPECIES: hypothetical protein [Frankia]KJE25551.1 hypothetical protein FF36_00167 [Frankia torreyi]KQM06195.1 hypothetical protein FF86_101072 [Frankia sp. CpI1-P]
MPKPMYSIYCTDQDHGVMGTRRVRSQAEAEQWAEEHEQEHRDRGDHRNNVTPVEIRLLPRTPRAPADAPPAARRRRAGPGPAVRS